VTPPRPLALVYHGVAAVPPRRDPEGLFTAPAALRRHIALLRRRGYRLVTFGELAQRAAQGRGDGLAALTFDDGLADNATILLPLLAAASVPATVFPVAGWLGREHPDAAGARILRAEEVRTLHRHGIEIGAHTVTHPDLTTLAPAQARAELRESREMLEAIIDAPVTSAAYPYGRATPATIQACADAGFTAACRVSGLGNVGDPLEFPREDIVNGATLLGVRLKIGGVYEPLMRHVPARALRRAYRMTRRTLVR
jgi:peptidoglycan/xylan/chitin deacetylase (PgdA/CDA1 family)